ncbi:hypothetical protein Taro_005982 [Colocasia esculenta]|uniref:Uncharacterized protein n=1 Tax=Colocasia esculenta TaxID=4460 RepID=A0A843TRA6_COLES|nr:hypothetical protein [Colocasia esculenta]
MEERVKKRQGAQELQPATGVSIATFVLAASSSEALGDAASLTAGSATTDGPSDSAATASSWTSWASPRMGSPSATEVLVEMKEERKVLKKFFAGRREELQMSREVMSESLGHRLRQPDERGKKLVQSIITQEKQPHNTRNYPSSDLLSLGVLRPVPEQQLRIPLTRVQSPYGHYNTQLSWSSFTRRELHHPGYPTRSSFHTEGNNNTLEALPGLPSTQKGTTTAKVSNKDKPLDQASTS